MTHFKILGIGTTAVVALAFLSLFVGAGHLSIEGFFDGGLTPEAAELLVVSRYPRTIATVLAGAGLAVAGLIMQLLSGNRFVEPSTVGTTESASLGMLSVTLLAPAMPVFGKMLVAAAFALGGTVLFMAIIRRLKLRSGLIVPLVGLILAGIIGAGASFIAYRYDLTQSLGAWMTGDFSMVLQGRYELLWIAALSTGIAILVADRFTLAGMGRDVAVGLGLSFGQTVFVGLLIVSLVTAVAIVSVGAIPFVGLVVPNLVAMVAGDNARRTVPYVALAGAGLVLACDILGRIARMPYEIPVGTIMGVIGSILFLAILFRRSAAHG